MAHWLQDSGAAGAFGAAAARAALLAGAALVTAAPGLAQAVAAPPATAAPPVRNAPQTFEIAAFDVVGVTRLDAITVERAVYPFSGPGKAATDVEAARKALEDAYKSRGYESVLVEIPPQPNESFVAGVVLLKVTEAVIGQVRVTGSKYHAPSIIAAQVPALKAGEVPNFSAAQEQLAAANRFPDREVTPSIKAGAVPGTIDVDLKVRDSLPLHGTLEVNNDHNIGTRPLRLAASLRYANLWQLGHTISGSYLVSPQDRSQSEVFSGSYLAPILGTRWSLLAYGFTSNSNVAALGGTQVLGDGYAIGVRAVYRLPGTVEHSVTFGVDYKDFNQDISIPSADPALPPGIIQTPIAYLPLVVSYARNQTSETTAYNVTASVTAGIRGFGSAEAIVQTQRFDALGNFVHLNLEADVTRALGGDFSAFASLSGQLADSPLVTNEQFGVGGITSIRGYFQSEAVGDDGVNGTFELRSPSLLSGFAGIVDEFRVFGFADGGYVRIRSPLPDQIDNFTLVSVGGGARFQLLRYLRANLAYGVALIDASSTQAGEGQFTFSIKAEF